MALAGGHLALLFGSFGGEGAHLGFVLCIEITIVGGNIDVDLSARLESCGWKLFGFVVTFGTPCDVVGVTEGVDVENIDLGWREEKVLDEGGEHVPWVEKEERHYEPEDVGRSERDD